MPPGTALPASHMASDHMMTGGGGRGRRQANEVDGPSRQAPKDEGQEREGAPRHPAFGDGNGPPGPAGTRGRRDSAPRQPRTGRRTGALTTGTAGGRGGVRHVQQQLGAALGQRLVLAG
eukprot:4047846-Prymnesium_polylepis.1